STQKSRYHDPNDLPWKIPWKSPDTMRLGRTTAKPKMRLVAVVIEESERWRMKADGRMVPLAGIEPALLAELDFESSASTSSATGAPARPARRRRSRSRRNIAGRHFWSTRLSWSRTISWLRPGYCG